MLPVNRPCLRMICFVAATTAFAPERATAEPITFFGEDLNLSGDPNTQIPHPNSEAVEALFLSNLTGVRTETFEGFAPQTESPLAIAFPGAGIATLTGRGEVWGGTTGAGQYSTSGANFWLAPTGGNFVIDFSNPIAAFGFYGVDVGENGGTLALVLTVSGGGTLTLPVPHTSGTSGSTDGSVLYFGFYDIRQTYTSVWFPNPGDDTDFFGFDDMTIGSSEQVTPIPEPASMLLLATGLAGAGARQLRRRRKPAPVKRPSAESGCTMRTGCAMISD